MESTRPIRALVRGLEALTVLNLRNGATVSEIAHDIGLPRTTVYRILETLREAGFVYRGAADERYHLTIRVGGLSAGFADERWMTEHAGPLLLDLAKEIAWPMHLATADGKRLVVRATTDYRSPFAMTRCCAGIHLPLCGSSAGRTYLAFSSAARRETLLDDLSSAGDEGAAPADRPALLSVLEDIRLQGHAALLRGRGPAEELNLSVPVLADERPVAILTVRFMTSALPARSGTERFLPKLRLCAAKISPTFSAQQAAVRGSGAPETAV